MHPNKLNKEVPRASPSFESPIENTVSSCYQVEICIDSLAKKTPAVPLTQCCWDNSVQHCSLLTKKMDYTKTLVNTAHCCDVHIHNHCFNIKENHIKKIKKINTGISSCSLLWIQVLIFVNLFLPSVSDFLLI